MIRQTKLDDDNWKNILIRYMHKELNDLRIENDKLRTRITELAEKLEIAQVGD